MRPTKLKGLRGGWYDGREGPESQVTDWRDPGRGVFTRETESVGCAVAGPGPYGERAVIEAAGSRPLWKQAGLCGSKPHPGCLAVGKPNV